MTEKERFDLCMSTKLGEILTEEFKTYLLANGFFSAPASTKYHGAYEGGLFDHSLLRKRAVDSPCRHDSFPCI